VGCDTSYVWVSTSSRRDVADRPFYRVEDATRWNKPGLAVRDARLASVVLRVLPDVVVRSRRRGRSVAPDAGPKLLASPNAGAGTPAERG